MDHLIIKDIDKNFICSDINPSNSVYEHILNHITKMQCYNNKL